MNKSSLSRPSRRLYSIEDASIYLGRSVNGIRQMMWSGKLPYIKDGKRVFLDIKDIDAWIDKSKETSTF